MARSAIVLHEGSRGLSEVRLARVLEFFGVPFKELEIATIGEKRNLSAECAIFGSLRTILSFRTRFESATALPLPSATYYMYSDEDLEHSSEAIRKLSGHSSLSLRSASAASVEIQISKGHAELTGPMTGLAFTLSVNSSERFLTGAGGAAAAEVVEIVSTADGAAFVRFQLDGSPAYFSTSPDIVDIEQTINKGFYDVKRHFCSAVPLVAFIKATFADVAWKPQELGGCLIIDDPLLKPVYGHCDFLLLRDLMQEHRFTTNIAFIPWNWRRTSPEAAKLFSDGSGNFSISIHGCDHTDREFGATSLDVLDSTADLAQSRMRRHEARTGIHYDPVMVFPQGVFSSSSPGILNRNNYLASVSTELIPADRENARTRIRDVWDVAMMAYGSLPIFTRRYAFHGLENFAFDLLLGKPCLIVAHHDFFKGDCVALVELIEKIESLNCGIRWRSLGNVIRGACRRRATGAGEEEIEMYGNELQVVNPSDHPIETILRKRIDDDDAVSEILCDQEPIPWTTEAGHLAFRCQVPPKSEKWFRVIHRERAHAANMERTMRFKLSVGTRRILSEFRDNYLSKSPYLSARVHKLKKMMS
jgi:hypothetical protein